MALTTIDERGQIPYSVENRNNMEVTHRHGPRCAEVCPKVDYETQGNKIAVLGAEVVPSDHESQATSSVMHVNKALTRKKR